MAMRHTVPGNQPVKAPHGNTHLFSASDPIMSQISIPL